MLAIQHHYLSTFHAFCLYFANLVPEQNSDTSSLKDNDYRVAVFSDGYNQIVNFL